MKIDWTFNLPYASHTEGVWERIIRLVRQILLAVTPKQIIRDDDLATLFAKVEAIVNSRPLTDVPLEVGKPTPLSPNHLLRVNAAVAKPFMLTDESDIYARQRSKIVQYAADQFWQRWLLEYPQIFQTRGKWHRTRRNFLVGDIVRVTDDCAPRGCWPLERVSKTFTDKNGLVRNVVVKTNATERKRPSCKLCVIVPSSTEENSQMLSQPPYFCNMITYGTRYCCQL